MYDLYLSTPLGARLAVLDRFESLQWTRKLNDVGALTLRFGTEQVDWRLWGLDRRVEVWRTSIIPKLVGIYYLRGTERRTEQGGERITWTGEDANGLLARRIIAYYSGSQQTDRFDYADDLMKETVKDNLGADADGGVDSDALRDITAYGFSIELDHGQGPWMSKDCAWQGLLTALQSIASTARDLGTRLYFEVMHPTMTTLQFRTYVHRQGADRTTMQAPFSLIRGPLATPVSIVENHGQEVNYLYVGGQGTEEDREIAVVSDAPACAASPFARCEALVDGTSYEDTGPLTDFGRKALQDAKVRNVFEGTLIDMPGSRYQVDWDLGDLVRAEYNGETFNCEVQAVMGTATANEETVTAQLVSYA